MKQSTLIGQATVPGGGRELRLYQGKDDCSIVMPGAGELMSTRRHASEDALATLPLDLLADTSRAAVLIGGLGMGFTLAAALAVCGPDAIVTVAELVPEVIEWNRGPLGRYAGYPVGDRRTVLYNGDVADLLRDSSQRFDVIALDVDNGPEAISAGGNNWIYSTAGIVAASESLHPGGVLAYWSASPDRKFVSKLKSCNLNVTEKTVFAHGKKGAKHIIWLATSRA